MPQYFKDQAVASFKSCLSKFFTKPCTSIKKMLVVLLQCAENSFTVCVQSHPLHCVHKNYVFDWMHMFSAIVSLRIIQPKFDWMLYVAPMFVEMIDGYKMDISFWAEK